MTKPAKLIKLGMIVLIVLSGCQKTFNRQPLEGELSYNGSPVKIGSVTFIPVNVEGPTTISAEVKDGKFLVPKENGLVPGSYTVRFSALDRLAIASPDTTLPAIPAKELLPLKYTYEGLVQEIKDGDKNFIKFDLK